MGDHHHQHQHGHHHPDAGEGRIALAFALNLGFSIIEFIGGLLTNSTAILADAVHDFGDAMAIGFGWWMARWSVRGADPRFTYGYSRLSLLGALVNSLILVSASVWVLWQAVPRLFEPVMPHAPGMIALAVLGIAVNGYAAYRLREGTTLNERVLNWHLLEDVLGWVAVLVVSLVLLVADWPILDPLLSVLFTAFILFNVSRLLRQTIKLFLQGVPDRVLQRQLSDTLASTPGVAAVHHLHLWSLDGERHVLTAHLDLAETLTPEQQRLLKQTLAERLAPYALAHTTLEFELPDEHCRDAP